MTPPIIYLLGYMGSGKTKTGRLLSKSLQFGFYDLDNYIETHYKKKINTIFSEEGENKFRELERIYLEELSQKKDIVIALGGGTPCFSSNMSIIKSTGTSIYLKASLKTLLSRLTQNRVNRPLINQLNESELVDFVTKSLLTRESFYLQADYTIDVEKININQLAANLKSI